MKDVLRKWLKVGDGVFAPRDGDSGSIVSIGTEEIQALKLEAEKSEKKRARLCAHIDNSSPLHQMIIVIMEESYVRPHRHANKIESFHLIEGEMDVVIFSDDGKILETIFMKAFPQRGGSVFYRLNKSLFHTVLVRSKVVVFQEITEGPFEPGGSQYANWSPPEGDLLAANEWMNKLKKEYLRA